ncbi:hypothetical protein PIB30_073291 [Stylosanthes scabra]|uniref:Uncharacterized protein n=1 Tax=Stylosanthes scabra TaxID=79078 RepID=A0ABU6TSB7_9FABA|nr:hypothetical protein [Stylosanthes scabra]
MPVIGDEHEDGPEAAAMRRTEAKDFKRQSWRTVADRDGPSRSGCGSPTPVPICLQVGLAFPIRAYKSAFQYFFTTPLQFFTLTQPSLLGKLSPRSIPSPLQRGLPRLCVDSKLVDNIRATPRLPGVRLGMEVLALGLRVDDPRICVDFYAYAWIGKVGGHA